MLALATATPADLPQFVQASAMVRDGFGFKTVTLGMHMRQMELPIAMGDARAALAVADDAVAWLTRQEEWFFESEAHRLRGEALSAMGDPAGADASYSRAIEVARTPIDELSIAALERDRPLDI
jgi:hypothetical protein